jgi:hypothetical protein
LLQLAEQLADVYRIAPRRLALARVRQHLTSEIRGALARRPNGER